MWYTTIEDKIRQREMMRNDKDTIKKGIQQDIYIQQDRDGRIQ